MPAAAAQAAALRPRGEPAAAEHGLVFDLGGEKTGARHDHEPFDPALAAAIADPFTEHGADIALDLLVGDEFGHGARRDRLCGPLGALLRRVVAQADDLQPGRGIGGADILVDGDEQLGRGIGDADDGGVGLAAEPAIGPEAGDRDAGGCVGRQRQTHAGQAGGVRLVPGERGLNNAEQPVVEAHHVRGDLEFGHGLRRRIRH